MSTMLEHGAYEDREDVFSSEEEEEETDAGLGIVEDDDDEEEAEVELAFSEDVEPGAGASGGAAEGGIGAGVGRTSGFYDTGHCYAFLERKMGWSEDECSGEAMDEVIKSGWRDVGGGGGDTECVLVWQHRVTGGWFQVTLPGGHKQAQWLLGLGWKDKLQRFCEVLHGEASRIVALRGAPSGAAPAVRAGTRGGKGRPGSAPPSRAAAGSVPPSAPAPNYIDVDPWQWTARDVGQWLGDIGLRQYANTFLHHGVTGRVLLRLTERKVKEDLEVRKLGDRECLLEELEELQDIAGAHDRGSHLGMSGRGERRPQSAREGRVAKSAARLEAEKRRAILERELPKMQSRVQQAERDMEEATRRHQIASADLERLMEKLRAVHRECRALSVGDERVAAGLQLQQSSFLGQDTAKSMMSKRSRELMAERGPSSFEMRMEGYLKSQREKLRQKEKLLRDVSAQERGGLDEEGVIRRDSKELAQFLALKGIPITTGNASDETEEDEERTRILRDVDWLNELFREHGVRLGLNEMQVRQLRHFSTARAKLKGAVGTLKRLEFESRLKNGAKKSADSREELKKELREQAKDNARKTSSAKQRVFVWTQENCLSYVTKTLRWNESDVKDAKIDEAVREGMPDPLTRLNIEGNADCLLVGPFFFPLERKIRNDNDLKAASAAAKRSGQVLVQNEATKGWELEMKTLPLGGGKNKADWLLLLRGEDKLREFSKAVKEGEFLKRLDAGERKKQAWLEGELVKQKEGFDQRYNEDFQRRKNRRDKLIAQRDARERQEKEKAASLNQIR